MEAAAEARRARIGPWPRRPARSTRSVRPARVAAAAVAARAAIAPAPTRTCARARQYGQRGRAAHAHSRMAARSRPRALCQPCTSPGSRSHASTSRYLCKRISHTADTQVTLRAGTSWSQVIDGVQCRVNVVRERGKLALMVTAGIGSGLDYDKFRITCPRAPSRTHSFAHRGYRIAAFCLGKCMLPCANCQNFLHGSRLSALAAVRYSPRGARRKKLRQNAQNWDFTVSQKSAALIREQTLKEMHAKLSRK